MRETQKILRVGLTQNAKRFVSLDAFGNLLNYLTINAKKKGESKMKRIGFLICAMLCANIAYAETSTINWYVDGTTYDTTTCTVGGDVNVPTAPTKRGYTFMGWEDVYTPIEYIGGYNNVQYIDTGIIPTSNMKIYTKFQYISTSGSEACTVFGSRSAAFYGVDLFLNSSQIDVDWFGTSNSNRWSIQNSALTNDIYECSIENSYAQLTKNGTVIGTHQFTPTGSNPYSLFINAVNTAGEVNKNKNCNLRIYAFQIWQNSTLIHDMIPVKDSNNVPCMYDKVNGRFYYNAGTGSFTAGPEI